jgi:lipoyl(octanoyl) transferase
MSQCWIVDCGILDYEESLVLQQRLLDLRSQDKIPDVLLLLEHPPVITMGVKATEDMLRVPRRILEQRGIPVIDTNRGGKITYHGPGQIVGYAIRRLGLNEVDAHLLGLEDTMLKTADEYGIKTARSYDVDEKHKRLPGVWCIINNKEHKLGAIGVEIKNGVSMHGFAFNVNPNLEHYDFIDMCGFKDRKATSMKKLLGRPILLQEVKEKLASNFASVFKYNIEHKSYPSLKNAISRFYANLHEI